MHRCRTNSARSFDRCVVAAVAWTVLVLSGCGGNSSNQNKLLSINVDPASSSLAVGAQLQYKAQGNFADGIPSELQQVAYSSSNVNIATITSGGLATGVAPGSATITAMSGGASGTATLNVEVQPDLLTITIFAAKFHHRSSGNRATGGSRNVQRWQHSGLDFLCQLVFFGHWRGDHCSRRSCNGGCGWFDNNHSDIGINLRHGFTRSQLRS